MTSPTLGKRTAVATRPSVKAGARSSRDRLTSVGGALRRHRAAKGLSLRQLARDLGVSASFISQLEHGKSQPSVATLFAICDALDVTVDQVFNETVASPGPAGSDANLRVADGGADSQGGDALESAGIRRGHVMRADNRPKLVLDTGEMWEQLDAQPDASGEFLLITYAVGGCSTTENELSRHNGSNYGFVISGELTLSLGFETFRLGPNDSISFDSSIPHRLYNGGTEPAQAVWFTLGNAPAFTHRTHTAVDSARAEV